MGGHNTGADPAHPASLRPSVKIRLAGAGPFFGPGVARLLEQVEKTGSVRMACEQLDMSYSKGWKILGNAEQELGYSIVVRKQGGKNGGAASLTPAGKLLLERFNAYERECQEAVRCIFERHFRDF